MRWFFEFSASQARSCKQKKQNWACAAKILRNLGKALTRRAVWRKSRHGFFFLLRTSARNALLAVVNAVKLNFATRRRGGFKFKGGSYLIGSDRSRPSRFLLAVASRAKEPPPFFFLKNNPLSPYDVRSCCTACRFIWRCRATCFQIWHFKGAGLGDSNL